MSYPSVRHFLQAPGPTNVPDRVLRAMAPPTIDHRRPAFQALALEVFKMLGPVFATRGPVVAYPGSGTGGWEAALVNTPSPGDNVLASRLGISPR
jgi:alanine-glyoxylate transaminase/serine-glyoxylate transaminase/serine-pyruvate transaminase